MIARVTVRLLQYRNPLWVTLVAVIVSSVVTHKLSTESAFSRSRRAAYMLCADQRVDIEKYIQSGAYLQPVLESPWAAHEDDWCYPIHIAADCGSVLAIELILQEGVDANTRDSNGMTPLGRWVSRCETPNLEIVDVLMRHEVDVNGECTGPQQGDTALHLATFLQQYKKSSGLCERGARADVRNSTGSTPLHSAVSRSPGLEEIDLWMSMIKELVDAGGNWRLEDDAGETPESLVMKRVDGELRDRCIEEFNLKGHFTDAE
jgi:ankyrin repeat protein